MANSPKIGQDFIVRNTKLWKMGGEDWEIYSQSHKILTEAWRQMNADPEFYEQTELPLTTGHSEETEE